VPRSPPPRALRRLQAWLLFSLYLKETHEFSFKPKPEDGPVTVTRELIIPPEDREKFLALVEQLRLIFLRNGAFLFRVDENLEHSGTFRTEMLVSSWAEHLRQFARMTKAETEFVERVWAMHAGEQSRLCVTTFRPTGYGLHLASVGSKNNLTPALLRQLE